MRISRTLFPALVAVLAIVAVPAAALGPSIDNGADLWRTPGNGTTFAKFDTNPIPADFFCSGSDPFTGRIVFEGVPLTTSPEGALGATDTIIHRLDNAPFDEHGVATTRIQVKAMQFQGAELFRNECGTFKVNLTLNGLQPISEMRIHREGINHGFFEAEIHVNVKISFVAVGHKSEALELTRDIRFPAARNTWASRPGAGGIQREGFILTDTDSDGQVDTYVPGTSRHFAAGWKVSARKPTGLNRISEGIEAPVLVEPNFMPEAEVQAITAGILACSINCHCEDEGVHCPEVVAKEAEFVP